MFENFGKKRAEQHRNGETDKTEVVVKSTLQWTITYKNQEMMHRRGQDDSYTTKFSKEVTPYH